MVIRRIREHVIARNWFAVGIDFLIVVAGIVVGTQVNNWNQAESNGTKVPSTERGWLPNSSQMTLLIRIAGVLGAGSAACPGSAQRS